RPVEISRGTRKRSSHVGIGSSRMARKPDRRNVMHSELAKYANATIIAITTTQSRPTTLTRGRGCDSVCGPVRADIAPSVEEMKKNQRTGAAPPASVRSSLCSRGLYAPEEQQYHQH